MSDWDVSSEAVHCCVEGVESVWPHPSDGRWFLGKKLEDFAIEKPAPGRKRRKK
jgi:hypothetical protein